MPAENLVSPEALRRLAWQPPEDLSVAEALTGFGARSWQVALVAEPLAAALPDPV